MKEYGKKFRVARVDANGHTRAVISAALRGVSPLERLSEHMAENVARQVAQAGDLFLLVTEADSELTGSIRSELVWTS